MLRNDLEYAGFWSRVCATIIDSILLGIITFPLLISIYGWEYFDTNKTGFIAGPLDFLISWVLPAIAIITFWIKKQATPGKMAISARIVNADTGAIPSTGQFIGRYFAYFLSAIPLGLGLIWVAFDKRKQGWHDKLAGTVVVRLKKRGPQMESKKRRPAIAVLLSIITPGLGQVYNGQLKKGAIFYFVMLLLPFLMALTGLQYRFYGMLGLLMLGLAYYLFIAGEALFTAIKLKEIILKSYNRGYYYLLFVILAMFLAISVNIITIEGLGIRAYRNPSDSMAPTLLTGDHIIVDLKHYKNNIPQKGDIIVFKYPENPKRDFIKRIIATEGDILESKEKSIFVNGSALNEPYVQYSDKQIRTNGNDPRDNFGPLTVPKDKVFVMGDNRDQSYDSRYWGYVDKDQIRGKALYIYWSKKADSIGMAIK